LAISDYDNDGDLDIFINNSNQSANLLRNKNGNKNNWITIKVRGTQSNRSGIGTRVKVITGDLSQTKEVRSGSSYLSQNDLRLLFGLDNYRKADHIEVRWPSGLKQKFSNIEANQILVIEEGIPADSLSQQFDLHSTYWLRLSAGIPSSITSIWLASIFENFCFSPLGHLTSI
jgi:hypothetical protein